VFPGPLSGPVGAPPPACARMDHAAGPSHHKLKEPFRWLKTIPPAESVTASPVGRVTVPGPPRAAGVRTATAGRSLAVTGPAATPGAAERAVGAPAAAGMRVVVARGRTIAAAGGPVVPGRVDRLPAAGATAVQGRTTRRSSGAGRA
jgi:hypothetical protein